MAIFFTQTDQNNNQTPVDRVTVMNNFVAWTANLPEADRAEIARLVPLQYEALIANMPPNGTKTLEEVFIPEWLAYFSKFLTENNITYTFGYEE